MTSRYDVTETPGSPASIPPRVRGVSSMSLTVWQDLAEWLLYKCRIMSWDVYTRGDDGMT